MFVSSVLIAEINHILLQDVITYKNGMEQVPFHVHDCDLCVTCFFFTIYGLYRKDSHLNHLIEPKVWQHAINIGKT